MPYRRPPTDWRRTLAFIAGMESLGVLLGLLLGLALGRGATGIPVGVMLATLVAVVSMYAFPGLTSRRF